MKADTTTLLSSAVNPSVSGQSVTLTAAVSVNAPGSTAVANPTGTVNFFDGFIPLGPGTLSTTGGVTTATFSTSTLSTSSHSLSASYGGGSHLNHNNGATTPHVNKTANTTPPRSPAHHTPLWQ